MTNLNTLSNLTNHPLSSEQAGIAFVNVSKRYTRDEATPAAVNNISFAVPQGSLTTILGPSGCGKTTTLRMIAGLESASSGQIFIGGRDVTQLSPAERNVSLVFQSYALFPHMRVIENVAYGLISSGMSKAQARERALNTLETVGLKHLAERNPSELSGGQQQRVAVARALVIEPQVLLFDEPLSNLDARLRRSMRDEIRSLQQRLKLTVAYVTHDQSEALAVSDYVIVMNHGLIAQMGTPQALYGQPANAFVAAFMGDATLLQGEAQGGLAHIKTEQGALQFACAPELTGSVNVAVRPHAWRLQDAQHDASARTGLQGTVVLRAYQGSHFELTIQTSLATILVNVPADQPIPEMGARVQIQVAQQGYAVVAS